ncbi:N-6 DNA methylase [bacterium]|nr:N-6 DNA methylase [bacterium]
MEKWLTKYFKVLQDKPDMGEIEWRKEMVPLIIEQGLGYRKNNIRFEKDRADIKIHDDNGIPHIIIETKLTERKLNKKALRQAFGYIQGGESYIVLASQARWKVFRPECASIDEITPIGEINLTEEDGLDNKELFLRLSESMMIDNERYRDFREGKSPSGYIQLDERGFDKLVSVMRLSFDMLYNYAEKVWPRQIELYNEYYTKRKELDELEDGVKHSGEKTYRIEERLQLIDEQRTKLERQYEIPVEAIEKSFNRFKQIQPYSRAVSDEQVTKIYLNEVCHLVLNRAIMIRILEDKGILKPKISNRGIYLWRELTTFIRDRYQYLLRFSFWDAELLYHHFFTEGIFDWYLKVDGELGDVVEKSLFLLNGFDFSDVDRDIMGRVYQDFFGPDKRKKLGEFYTPDEVIKYLLKKAGWPGEGKLFDFACGSGGFLVEALKQSLDDGEKRGISPEECWRQAGNIVGLDINPFAVHIAEMNLLFLMVNQFKEIVDERVKNGIPVQLPDMEVFRIDALLDGRELVRSGDSYSSSYDAWPGERFTDALIARDLKGAYRYIVGNPPYVRNERLDPAAKDWYDKIFADVKEGNTDIYAYFIRKAMDWLEPGGRIAVILSQGFANARSSLKVRRYIEQYTIEELVPLEWADVFLAAVIPFLLVLKKEVPSKGHKIHIRQGLRHIKELESKKDRSTYIKQSEWVNLSPDSSWRMEITDEDIPIIKKLSQYPTLFSGSYGLTARSKEILVGNDTSKMKNPKPVLDGREIKAWSVEWQGRYIDYNKEKISDPKSDEYFKSTKVVLPRISLTSQASVLENEFYYRDTVMRVNSDDDISPYAVCCAINSLLNRYYSFLILRSNPLLAARNTIYPRVIGNMISAPTFCSITDLLESLGKKCHSLAYEMVNGDRDLIDKIDGLLGIDRIHFSDLRDSDLSSLAGDLKIANAHFSRKGELSDGSLFFIRGDNEALYFLAHHAQLKGKARLHRKDIEAYELPKSNDTLKQINKLIRDWLKRKPTLADRLRKTENEIDEIIFGACEDLTKEEIATIKRRCTEYPLSEVLKTSLPGIPTRQIPVKTYKDRYK